MWAGSVNTRASSPWDDASRRKVRGGRVQLKEVQNLDIVRNLIKMCVNSFTVKNLPERRTIKTVTPLILFFAVDRYNKTDFTLLKCK